MYLSRSSCPFSPPCVPKLSDPAKISSNWSTTSRLRCPLGTSAETQSPSPSRPLDSSFRAVPMNSARPDSVSSGFRSGRDLANSSKASSPGRVTAIRQVFADLARDLKGRPRRRAGIRPARTSDDFPLPESPITARKPVCESRSASWADSRSRPKKRRESSTSKLARPTKGSLPAESTDAGPTCSALRAETILPMPSGENPWRKSCHWYCLRKEGSRSGSEPGPRIGMSRKSSSRTLRSSATRTSLSTQLRTPLRPTSRRNALEASSALSIAFIHSSPGFSLSSSSHTSIPTPCRRRFSSLACSESSPAWLRKITSNRELLT